MEKGTQKTGTCETIDCDTLGFHRASFFLLSYVKRHTGSKQKKQVLLYMGKGAETGQVIMVPLMGPREWGGNWNTAGTGIRINMFSLSM